MKDKQRMKDNQMDQKTNHPQRSEISENPEANNRREAVRKLGKFAAYAAPFTVLAFSKKASAATGTGPGKTAGPTAAPHR
jgi:hypothetical protein